jgi:hypothetical protein
MYLKKKYLLFIGILLSRSSIYFTEGNNLDYHRMDYQEHLMDGPNGIVSKSSKTKKLISGVSVFLLGGYLLNKLWISVNQQPNDSSEESVKNPQDTPSSYDDNQKPNDASEESVKKPQDTPSSFTEKKQIITEFIETINGDPIFTPMKNKTRITQPIGWDGFVGVDNNPSINRVLLKKEGKVVVDWTLVTVGEDPLTDSFVTVAQLKKLIPAIKKIFDPMAMNGNQPVQPPVLPHQNPVPPITDPLKKLPVQKSLVFTSYEDCFKRLLELSNDRKFPRNMLIKIGDEFFGFVDDFICQIKNTGYGEYQYKDLLNDVEKQKSLIQTKNVLKDFYDNKDGIIQELKRISGSIKQEEIDFIQQWKPSTNPINLSFYGVDLSIKDESDLDESDKFSEEEIRLLTAGTKQFENKYKLKTQTDEFKKTRSTLWNKLIVQTLELGTSETPLNHIIASQWELNVPPKYSNHNSIPTEELYQMMVEKFEFEKKTPLSQENIESLGKKFVKLRAIIANKRYDFEEQSETKNSLSGSNFFEFDNMFSADRFSWWVSRFNDIIDKLKEEKNLKKYSDIEKAVKIHQKYLETMEKVSGFVDNSNSMDPGAAVGFFPMDVEVEKVINQINSNSGQLKFMDLTKWRSIFAFLYRN